MDIRILCIERNLRRLMDHFGMEYEGLCVMCVAKTNIICEICEANVCGDCHIVYESQWEQIQYQACSIQCSKTMRIWERTKPFSCWSSASPDAKTNFLKKRQDEDN